MNNHANEFKMKVYPIVLRTSLNYRETVRRFFEQIRLWSKANQAKKKWGGRLRLKRWVRMFKPNKNRWITVVACLYSINVFSAPSPSGNAKLGVPGVVWSTTYTPSLPSTTRNDSRTCMNGYTIRTDKNVSIGRTSDGQYGIVLGPDVVYQLAGQFEMKYSLPYEWIFYNSAQPSVTNSWADSVEGSGSMFPWSLDRRSGQGGYNAPAKTQGSVTARIWVGPAAEQGSYSVPSVSFGQYKSSSCEYDYETISDSGLISVSEELSCIISAPPAIDFGIIHGLGIKENSYITQQTGNLTVNCSSDSQNSMASIKLQVLGEPAPCCNYLLWLKTDSGANSPGEIRGWINQSPTETCSGYASTTDGLVFGDSSKWYDGGELKVGTNLIPYVFNLCGSGSNKVTNLGPASATATINVSWD